MVPVSETEMVNKLWCPWKVLHENKNSF